jgi:transposase InsO family protein
MSGVVSSLVSPVNNLKLYVSSSLSEVIRLLEGLRHDRNEFGYVLYKLEQVVQVAIRSEEQGLWQQVFPEQLLDTLIDSYNILLEDDFQHLPGNSTCRPTTVNSGSVGRPALDIPKETLKMFLNYGFSLIKISEMLGVSRKTISRRIRHFGLLEEVPRYTNISNVDLDVIVSEIYHEFPNCGIRRMKGFLIARGIRIQWERVRSSLWRVDPEGVLLRTMQLNLVKRRHYSVPGPLSLWHLDGNHKIIRWGFVIHGCVDGYSRRIMFLKASTNNKASTVFTVFMEAVEKFGLPQRIRGDQGGENVDVAWFMFSNPSRGPGRGSFIAGKSCHNQRIERFWRDLFHGCTFIFYYVFWYLEENDYLDVSNETHLFCLHYVFLPRINRHLNLFQDGYDNHPLRTESNMTPVQLWVSGSNNLLRNTVTPNDLGQSNLNGYGIDFEGPLPSARYNGETWRDIAVEVPQILCPVNDAQYRHLSSIINPLTSSSCYGIDLYVRTVQIVENILGNTVNVSNVNVV